MTIHHSKVGIYSHIPHNSPPKSFPHSKTRLNRHFRATQSQLSTLLPAPKPHITPLIYNSLTLTTHSPSSKKWGIVEQYQHPCPHAPLQIKVKKTYSRRSSTEALPKTLPTFTSAKQHKIPSAQTKTGADPSVRTGQNQTAALLLQNLYPIVAYRPQPKLFESHAAYVISYSAPK